VWPLPPAIKGVSHFVGVSRRQDGSVRDHFTNLPSPDVLRRVSLDSKAQHERVRVKYPTLAHERPELFE
jgi:hypothetical protein